MQSWDLVLTFLVLAEESQYGAAADRLGVSRQTLRRRVDRLESELGVELLLRGRQRIELTAAGAILLELSLPIAESIGKMVEQVRRETPDRPLSVGLTTDVSDSWARRVEAWVHRRQEPAVLAYRPSDLALRLVRQGKTDLLLFAGNYDDPINSMVVAHEPAVVLFPEAHPAAAQEAIHVGDLRDLPVAVSDAGHDDHYRSIVERLHGDPRRPFIIAPRLGTAVPGLLLAARTQGAAVVVLESSIERHDTSGLAVRPLDPPFLVPMTLVRRLGLPDEPFRGLADHLMSMRSTCPETT